MFSKKNNKITNLNIIEMNDLSKKSIPSIIVSDLNIKGDLVSEGAIEIGGKVKGNILCDHVTIRRDAKINGNIKAKQLIVHGAVNGEISAANLSVTATGVVRGTIEYGYMNVESGADIECHCKKIMFKDETNETEQEFIPKIENIINNNKDDIVTIDNKTSNKEKNNKNNISRKKSKK